MCCSEVKQNFKYFLSNKRIRPSKEYNASNRAGATESFPKGKGLKTKKKNVTYEVVLIKSSYSSFCIYFEINSTYSMLHANVNCRFTENHILHGENKAE